MRRAAHTTRGTMRSAQEHRPFTQTERRPLQLTFADCTATCCVQFQKSKATRGSAGAQISVHCPRSLSRSRSRSLSLSLYLSLSLSLSIYLSIYIYIYIHTIYVYTYTHLVVCIHTHLCIYITYTNIYIYIYIYIYIDRVRYI